jgi:hypothetical protein
VAAYPQDRGAFGHRTAGAYVLRHPERSSAARPGAERGLYQSGRGHREVARTKPLALKFLASAAGNVLAMSDGVVRAIPIQQMPGFAAHLGNV